MKDVKIVIFTLIAILLVMTVIFKSIGKDQNKIYINKKVTFADNKDFITKEKCVDGIVYIYYLDTKNKRSGLTTKFGTDGIETCGE